MASRQCWLVRSDGTRIRVGRRGVFIGRGAGCDVVVLDARTSGTHALVWLTPLGPELIAFGRNATRLEGIAIEGTCSLVHGAQFAVPGEEFRIEYADPTAGQPAPVWVVAADEDRPVSIYRTAITVGGGGDDDLQIRDWPSAALVLSPDAGALAVRFHVEASVGDDSVAAGTVRLARVGDEIRIGRSTLVVMHRLGAAEDDAPVAGTCPV